MATKPASGTARWGELVDGTPAANLSTPSAGQRNTGWTNGQVPPSGVQNSWQNEVYAYLKYLHDGAFSGNHNIDGNLDLTGTVTADDDIIAGGDIFYSTPRVLTIPAAAFSGNGSTSTVDTWVFSQVTNGSFVGPHWEKIASTDVWLSAPVILDVGSTISNCRVTFDRNGNSLEARLVAIDVATGARTVIGTQTSASGSGRNVNFSVASGSFPYVTLADTWYVIEVDSVSSGSVVFGASVTHHRGP
jgi:hypothetical protein